MPKNESESPEQRFRRVAAARTNAVIDRLRLLGNCSNRRIYKYTPKDVGRILLAINKELNLVKLKFNTKKRERFKL